MDAAATDLGADTSADLGRLDTGAVDAPDTPDTGPARCTRDEECHDNELGHHICDVASGRCVTCSPAADNCLAGQFCEGATFRCVPGCRNEDGCAPGLVTADGGVSTDGGAAAGLHCEVATRRCLACLRDEHCPAGLVCTGNQCVAGCNATQACPTGLNCCGGGCVDPQANTAHCGGCDMACMVTNGAPRCAMGACAVASCTGSFGDCDGMAGNGCETNTATTAAHCGACGQLCAPQPNATERCAEGTCTYTCNAGFADCNGSPADGCEVDTRSNPANCGACDNACVAANGAATCTAGVCGLGACNAGFANCNGRATDGCEVTLAIDTAHCGTCTTVCPTGAICAARVCACPLGNITCSGACVNVTSDSRNCGACGTICPTGRVCRSGSCQATCASGSTLCGIQCVTLGDDPANCGSCGNRCASDSTCASGVCVRVVTIDAIGCADGTRESFVDRTRFPLIAGCSGAWSLPGIFPAIPASALAACVTLGNSSTTAPTNGAGCASSNLCASGWHICFGGEVTPRTVTGCGADLAAPATSFFAAAVSGPGCGRCALRSGTLTGTVCGSNSCRDNCHESGDLNNDFFGCGGLGRTAVFGFCDGLNRTSGDNCASLTAPWVCGGSIAESRTVTKSGSAAGGVLCCRD